MALVKQFAVAVLVLLVAGAAWLRLDPAPGQYLLSDDSPLPGFLRPVVAAVATSETARIGATPRRDQSQAAQLVTVDPARADVTRDRLQAIGTGEARRTVAIYPDATGIITSVAFRPGEEVEEGEILATLENDAQILAVDRARIALQAARDQAQRFEALASSVTAVQVADARRAVDTANLDLRAAEIELGKRTITAPIAGRVGLSPLEVGALVGSQTLIATIDDREQLKVVFNAPEAFVSEIAVGDSLSATPTARTGRVYDGQISALDSRIDEASRTLRTEALIDNSADDLRPGMSFTVDIGFAGNAYVSVLPLAIQWERSGSFVWVVTDGTVSKAPVQIIERNVERVLVASDVLAAGDAVVVEGTQQLREGQAVRTPESVDAPPEDVPTLETPPSVNASPASGQTARESALGVVAPTRLARNSVAADGGLRP
ncbi:efflux RND transporter periplasmic adaptor subunit [Aureimonas mangrovi]|uniref:efflux RND transporter periplasmic adaptor subunit n=1 Tax=Aureimonas mangrovi TaxID=2758041 RepID=UPI00163D4247|nr:efflux RND transporter periplasmic adaptor subunit [Aureimonas mangrovi]